MNKAVNMYKTNQVSADINNASKKELLLMLYDGVISNLNIAKDAIATKNIGLKLQKIEKTLSIIEMGLLACLDRNRSKEVAESLENFYMDAYQKIVWANANNNPSALEEVRSLFVDLRKCWEKA